MSKLTDAANGQSCVRCGKEDGTTVSCHYSGPWQHKFGKGRAIKGNDAAAADLCNGPGSCHEYFDEYKSGNTVERSDEFLMCCMLTVIRRIQQGVLR